MWATKERRPARKLWLPILCSTTIAVLLVTNFGVYYSHESGVSAPQACPPVASTPQVTIYRPALSTIPPLGFGTWQLQKSNASEAVALAIETGYRHIDCASSYWNEPAVGRGIAEGLKRAGLKREDIWVTSKLWNYHHHRVDAALTDTLNDLGLDHVDLYLMHWPVAGTFAVGDDTSVPPKSPPKGPRHIEYLQTWNTMIRLLSSGRARHIGVANFDAVQLETLLKNSAVRPFAHQMELHPYLPQDTWLQQHAALGISVVGYSPLGNMNPIYEYPKEGGVERTLEHPVVLKIAQRRGCTPGQAVVRWGLSRGVSIIPKSSHADRIRENFEAKECRLTIEDFREMREVLGTKEMTRFNDVAEMWGVPGELYEGLDDSHIT